MNARIRSGLLLAALSAFLLGGSSRVGYAQAGRYVAMNGWRDFSGSSFRFDRPANGMNPSDYVAATYYFYWYDDTTGQYLFTANTPTRYDTLGLHPAYVQPRPVPAQGVAFRPWGTVATPPRFSFKEPGWHRRELRQIADAGLDLLLVDYWGRGDDKGADDWFNVGLSALDEAAAGLNRDCPRIGLFYDTNTLLGADPPRISFDDFSQEGIANQEAFYRTIRDFFSRIEPSRWGRFNGAAIVWLYTSNIMKDGRPLYFRSNPAGMDLFEDCRARFARDFGGSKLFFVGDIGWALVQPRPLKVDMVYGWGAASTPSHVFAAPRIPIDVNSVGARFDVTTNLAVQKTHNQHPAKPTPVFPCDEATYQRAWREANSGPNRVIAVETWNELLESTGILPSVEFGTMYYDATRRGVHTLHFNGDFVRQAYLYALKRPVDGLGYGTKTASMDARSLSPAQLRDDLLNSREAADRISAESYVDFLYRRYLRREPTRQESAGWLARLEVGSLTRSAARDAMLGSAEARTAIADGDFVTALYDQILDRTPDPPGYDLTLKALTQGVSRADLIRQFLNSEEIQQKEISSKNGRLQPIQLFDFAGY